MIFPCAELKIGSYMVTAAVTVVTLRLYRVDDGGLDAEGQPRYARTLLRERTVRLDAGWDGPRILEAAKDRLVAWATEHGYNLPAERLICTL